MDKPTLHYMTRSLLQHSDFNYFSVWHWQPCSVSACCCVECGYAVAVSWIKKFVYPCQGTLLLVKSCCIRIPLDLDITILIKMAINYTTRPWFRPENAGNPMRDKQQNKITNTLSIPQSTHEVYNKLITNHTNHSIN